MKTLAFFISTSLVLSSLINIVIARGFFRSCSNLSMSGSMLEYTCTDNNGQPNSGATDLDLCIINNNSNLQHSAKYVSVPKYSAYAAVVQYVLNDSLI